MKKYLLFILLPVFLVVLAITRTPYNSKDKNPRRPNLPYITGDAFRSHSDFIFDETNQKFNPDIVKKGDIIFVKTDLLDKFFTGYHDKISNKYILVSHNSDEDVPITRDLKDYTRYLEDEKIIVWFSQNVNRSHKKLIPVPIGVENRYCSGKKLKVINKYRLNKFKINKKYLLYMNFNIANWPEERSFVDKLFEKQSYCRKTDNIPYKRFFKEMASSNFILCPRGNGLDCHRTWESLYLKSIPIVRSSAMDPIYKNLPVIIVNNWN
jgi:hypothetical protein